MLLRFLLLRLWSSSVRGVDHWMALAVADNIRRDRRMRRSALTNRFVAKVDAALATRLSPDELQEARRECRSVDLRRLVADETARLKHN